MSPTAPFLAALGIGLVLMPVARRAGLALGLVDRPGDDLKIHRGPVSVLGGVAVVVAALGATTGLGEAPPPAVVGGVVLALALGMSDDAWSLPVWARAGGQALIGLVLVAGGLRLEPLGILGAAGMVFTVVACANAVNMLDGQDGLAGGLATIGALGLAWLAAVSGDGLGRGLGLALAGGLVAFLAWNRPPARLFLGNGGAYAVGTLLAILPATISAAAGWRGLLAAGVCLGVFALEFTLTVGRRLFSRTPLVAGDRLHSYDLLAERAGGRGRATLAFWGLGGLAVVLAVLVQNAPLLVGIGTIVIVGAASLGCGVYLTAPIGRVRRAT
jgi:UDP-GlcNAc:undecaprenyl-phosphate GlcNAc-1-phosphate transferase